MNMAIVRYLVPVIGKHFEVFRALVEAGGDVNKLDSGGQTALHDASSGSRGGSALPVCGERGGCEQEHYWWRW